MMTTQTTESTTEVVVDLDIKELHAVYVLATIGVAVMMRDAEMVAACHDEAHREVTPYDASKAMTKIKAILRMDLDTLFVKGGGHAHA